MLLSKAHTISLKRVQAGGGECVVYTYVCPVRAVYYDSETTVGNNSDLSVITKCLAFVSVGRDDDNASVFGHRRKISRGPFSHPVVVRSSLFIITVESN